MHDGEFTHPVLAGVYEALCPWGVSDSFFLEVANERPASRILDLGCGTGQVTLTLARAGHRVTGIDPAQASLEVARARPGAGKVTWLEGTSAQAPASAFDLALMTNHVAQFLTGDDEWALALADLRRALVPGGRLVFDSRDPAARGWEAWNPQDSVVEVTLEDGRHLANWTEVVDVTGELVTFVHHYQFSYGLALIPEHPGKRRMLVHRRQPVLFGARSARMILANHLNFASDRSEELRSRSTLRFRPEKTLRDTLTAAGFGEPAISGGWKREPVGAGDGEFIVVATVPD